MSFFKNYFTSWRI